MNNPIDCLPSRDGVAADRPERLPSPRLFAGLKRGEVVIAWRRTYASYMTCRVLNWGVMRNGKPFVSLLPFEASGDWVSSFVCHPRRISEPRGFKPVLGRIWPGCVKLLEDLR